jgi:hypothetical protein
VRTRLAIPKEDAAGPPFRRRVLGGDGAAACEAVLEALRAGATPRGVASGLAVAAAERLVALPAGDRQALEQAGHVLLYSHALHMAMRQSQDPEIYPLLYTGAVAVNALRAGEAAPALASTASVPLGGLIAPALLRSLERQIASGDTSGALASARRYVQMGHAPMSLAGVLGSAASRWDARGSGVHTLPLVAAAAEEYLTQPGMGGGPGLPSPGSGQSPLLAAAIRLASELSGDSTLAGRVDDAIAARVAQA